MEGEAGEAKNKGLDLEDMYFVFKRKHQMIMDKVTPYVAPRWGIFVL